MPSKKKVKKVKSVQCWARIFEGVPVDCCVRNCYISTKKEADQVMGASFDGIIRRVTISWITYECKHCGKVRR